MLTVRVEGVCDDIAPVIQASHSDWRIIERSWSFKDSPRGWRREMGDSEIAIAFRPAEGLEEESWQWRARVEAQGVLTEGGRSASFRVDVTPPAEIEGLRLQRRPDGAVLLRWEPVALDIEGRPESVDHYVIYRYDRRGTFPQGPLVKLGVSHAPVYLDRRDAAQDKNRADPSPLLDRDAPTPPHKSGKTRSDEAPAATIYYKIVAVDVAGNELGVREGGAGTPQVVDPPPGSPARPPTSGGDGSGPRERPL